MKNFTKNSRGSSNEHQLPALGGVAAEERNGSDDGRNLSVTSIMTQDHPLSVEGSVPSAASVATSFQNVPPSDGVVVPAAPLARWGGGAKII